MKIQQNNNSTDNKGVIFSTCLIFIGYIFSILFSSDYLQTFKTSTKYLLFPFVSTSLFVFLTKYLNKTSQNIAFALLATTIALSAIIKKTSNTTLVIIIGSILIFVLFKAMNKIIAKPTIQKLLKNLLISLFVFYACLIPVKYALNKNDIATNKKIQNITTSFHLATISPITGIGANEYKLKYPNINNQLFSKPLSLDTPFPNNIIMSFWLNFGFPGLIGIITLIIEASKKITPQFLALSFILFVGIWSNVYFQIGSCLLLWFYLVLSLQNEK